MILPSRRWFLVAAALATLALLGYLDARLTLVWLGASTLWVGAFAVDAVRAHRSGRGVSVRRDALDSFSVGRPQRVRYRWRGDKEPLRVVVREAIPPLFSSTDGGDRELMIAADRDTIDERELLPIARGREREWRFDLRIASPLGLAVRQLTLRLPWVITVYPRLPATSLKSLPAQSRARREAGLRPVRRIGEGRLFESLREWVPGDELRAVDWKASGRRGKLIARQYEEERRQRVTLMLDAGRMLTAESDGRARLEDAIEAVAQLAIRATEMDDDVGLLVFSDRIETYLPPARGRRALRLVLDALAGVTGKMVESDYPLAFSHLAFRSRKRSLPIIFSDVIDRFASDAIVAQVGGLRPRHVPVIVAIRDQALERAASEPVTSVAGGFDRAAAEHLLAARNEALGAIRQAGVVVVDTSAGAAARSVVECYLTLKRRALV